MQIDNKKILPLLLIITLILLPIVYWTTGNFRIIISLIVLLLTPGYTLLAALFPEANAIGVTERIALSLGISLAIVPVLGLIVHFSPWGLSIDTILIALIIFIFVTSGIGWHRNSRLGSDERLIIRIHLRIPVWSQLGKMEKSLSIILISVLIILSSVFVWAIVSPNAGENYTEFYILDAQGTTQNYPEKVVSGENVEIMVGVISHEKFPADYIIEIKINGELAARQETGSLNPDQKWQQGISFTPHSTGKDQEVEFWLFKEDDLQPYNKDSLHFNIDVSTHG